MLLKRTLVIMIVQLPMAVLAGEKGERTMTLRSQATNGDKTVDAQIS
jgi:hypothetical protein